MNCNVRTISLRKTSGDPAPAYYWTFSKVFSYFYNRTWKLENPPSLISVTFLISDIHSVHSSVSKTVRNELGNSLWVIQLSELGTPCTNHCLCKQGCWVAAHCNNLYHVLTKSGLWRNMFWYFFQKMFFEKHEKIFISKDNPELFCEISRQFFELAQKKKSWSITEIFLDDLTVH